MTDVVNMLGVESRGRVRANIRGLEIIAGLIDAAPVRKFAGAKTFSALEKCGCAMYACAEQIDPVQTHENRESFDIIAGIIGEHLQSVLMAECGPDTRRTWALLVSVIATVNDRDTRWPGFSQRPEERYSRVSQWVREALEDLRAFAATLEPHDARL